MEALLPVENDIISPKGAVGASRANSALYEACIAPKYGAVREPAEPQRHQPPGSRIGQGRLNFGLFEASTTSTLGTVSLTDPHLGLTHVSESIEG